MRPIVLIIAGSDSSGGAGLLRDVEVLTRFDVGARCVVTAVTAQTNMRIVASHCLPPQLVRDQMSAALEAGGISAIKIGMLGSRATIEAVAEILPSRNHVPIVLDPVLESSSGGLLLEASGLSLLRELLLPRVTLVTPNLPEAARLLSERQATEEEALIEQARGILRFGPEAVLLKGGHGAGEEAVDLFVTGNNAPVRIRTPRINGVLRGTGCALSSAIAASLALQASLPQACERAKHYVWNQLQRSASLSLP